MKGKKVGGEIEVKVNYSPFVSFVRICFLFWK